MNRILLIWEEIPESCKLYWLDPIDQNEYDRILSAHGQYVNHDDSAGADYVSLLLAERKIPEIPPDAPIHLVNPSTFTIVLSGFIL